MITEASEDEEGYLPSWAEHSLTHSFPVWCIFKWTPMWLCSAWHVQLSSAEFLPRGHSFLRRCYFPPRPLLPNCCCGILIAFPRARTFFFFFYQGTVEQTVSATVSTTHSPVCVFVVCYCCCNSFHCFKPAGSVPDGFSFFFFFLEAHIHAASRGRHTASLCFVQVYRCKNRGATVCFDVLFFLCSRSDVCFCEAWDIQNWIFSCQLLSSTAVQSCSVKSFLFTVKECRERVSPPFQSQQKGGPVQTTECLNAQTVNGHRFCQLPTTRKQTPHLLLLCVCAPTAKCGWNKGQWQSDHRRHIFEGSLTAS